MLGGAFLCGRCQVKEKDRASGKGKGQELQYNFKERKL